MSKQITNKDLLKWINDGSFRRVEITPHCSGMRVTLYEESSSLSFSVKEDFFDAFGEALKYYPQWKLSEFKEKTEGFKKEIQETEDRLNFLKRKHNIAKKLFKEAQQVDDEKMIKILDKKDW